MTEEMLSALEREARGKSWRVSFLRNGVPDALPESGGYPLRIARAKEKRIKAIAAALGITDIVVVSTLVLKAQGAIAQPVPGVLPVSRHKSRLRSIAESEGIDLDLLVNPDALEALSQEITVIR
jgi:hypothetical protein